MSSFSISANKMKEIIKLHQKKYRDELKLFIVEGFKALEEIIEANIEIVEIYALNSIKLPKGAVNVQYVDEKTMKKISTTSSTCEILTIAKQKKFNVDNLKNYKRIALFENISDPGNLGTIIRSAAAFGIDGIILFNDCVELYSPKVIRSSAGNFFKVPVIQMDDVNLLKDTFFDFKFISTDLANTNNISILECKQQKKYVLMFGSEATGLTKNLIDIADNNILLDMASNVESLNLSVSASILFYELK